MNIWRQNIINFLVLGLLPIYILIHIFIISEPLGQEAISDSGYISIITLTFIGCTLLALVTLIPNKELSHSKLTIMAIIYVILIYFLREADFHRLFTLEHITKAKFYTAVAVPFWQKILVGFITLLFVFSFTYLLIKYIRIIWKKFREFEPWAIALILWFSTLLFSQICDKSRLNDIYAGRVIEECSECFASIFIFLAVIQGIPMLFTNNTSAKTSVDE